MSSRSSSSREHWAWLYKIAVDIPKSPSPKTQRAYEEFFRALRVVLPDEKERALYRKITTHGPFKLTGETFSKGPEAALEFVVDVHNGILLSQGKKPSYDAQKLWKSLKLTRSSRDGNTDTFNDDVEDLFSVQIKDEKQLNSLSKNGKLIVVLYDTPHFLRLFPRPDKAATKTMAEIKARYPVTTAIAAGDISYRYYWKWKQRVSKFPFWRVFKDGKIVTESSDGDDIRRFLKQRAMKGQQMQYMMHNMASPKKRSPSRPAVGPSAANGLAYGLTKGVGETLGRAAVPHYGLAKTLAKAYFMPK